MDVDALPRLEVTKLMLLEFASNEPILSPPVAGTSYLVMWKVREKPCDGIGPMTAPSVQQVTHRQEAVPVPAAVFQVTSPLSSDCTIAVLPPASPVLVHVIHTRLAPLYLPGMGASRPTTRYTLFPASMTMYTLIASWFT